VGLLYFFFNQSNQKQTAEEVIRVLLKQALRQLQQIPSEVQNEYKRYKKDPHKITPTREKYQSLLECSLQEFAKLSSNPVFVLMDAYDEFVNPEGFEEQERTELRSSLVKLCGLSSARILITTRPQHVNKLEDTFVGSRATSQILGDMDDIE
jgi:arginine utilization protein RocB